MLGFAGFPPGKNPYIPLPEQFFTVLLPDINDIGELKVSLHLFRLLYQKYGDPRCVSDRELLSDQLLRRAMRRPGDPRPVEEQLRAALELALLRGTLLRVRVRVDDGIVSWYFFNTERSRMAVARLQRGEDSPELLLELEDPAWLPGEGGPVYAVELERPNIFSLYEQNIGVLPPLLAEELREAEVAYPYEWIEEAFRLAVLQNKRRWSYIRAILERWQTEGKGEQAYGAHG
ncbi:MAG: DnaD domain-containing protein [Ktedonobacterales bacterium]